MKLATKTAGVVLAALTMATAAAAQNNGHAHVGHAADGFRGTPEGAGLLPTAVMEAEVAAQHAGLAARAGDLAAIKRHIGHVMHALDPESTSGGPGKGYGMIRAASGAGTHIGLAAQADAASDNLKRHAEHVQVAANTAAEHGAAALEKARMIQDSNNEAAAREMAEEIAATMQRILEGHDANGDGRVGWGGGEGGLAQATTHLNLLKRGEGLGG